MEMIKRILVDWLWEGIKEWKTTLPGVIILILYALGKISPAEFTLLAQVLEQFGLVVPVVGGVLTVAPTAKLKQKVLKK